MYSASRTRDPLGNEPDRLLVAEDFRRLVLVVEDEPDIRSMVAEHLLGEGFAVCVAQTGEIAMQVVRERRPGVVCLDLNLPRISGYDVCEQIRADLAIKDTSILITSARNSLDAMVFSLEAGADAYLAKPYQLKHLTKEIGRLFELRMRDQSDTTTLGAGKRVVTDSLRARGRAWP